MKGPENAPVARFDGFGCYQSRSGIGKGLQRRKAVRSQRLWGGLWRVGEAKLESGDGKRCLALWASKASCGAACRGAGTGRDRVFPAACAICFSFCLFAAMSAPDRYAVIGHPIGHSLSPQIHALFARATGQCMTYEALDGGAQPGGFEAALAAFAAAGGRGLNVTLPFKLRALAAAHAASDEARLAGAANTLRFDAAGRIEAHNTDGAGLVRDITARLRQPLQGRRVLLLGAGGAARGALLPLARAGVARLDIANRSAGKAEALAAELAPRLSGCPVRGMGLEQLAALAAPHEGFDVVINATSASLAAQPLAVPAALLAAAALAYDMVYGAAPTPFMQAARLAGCPRQSDGLGMLVEQAAESFAWWRGVRPDTGAVLDAVRAALLARQPPSA